MPEQGILDIASVGGGTLTGIFVHEGQRVKKGERLASLSGDISTSLERRESKIARQLHDQRDVLNSELQNLEAINTSTMQGLNDRIGLLKEQSPSYS